MPSGKLNQAKYYNSYYLGINIRLAKGPGFPFFSLLFLFANICLESPLPPDTQGPALRPPALAQLTPSLSLSSHERLMEEKIRLGLGQGQQNPGQLCKPETSFCHLCPM